MDQEVQITAGSSLFNFVTAIITKLTIKKSDNNNALFRMLPVICSIIPKPNIPMTMANFPHCHKN